MKTALFCQQDIDDGYVLMTALDGDGSVIQFTAITETEPGKLLLRPGETIVGEVFTVIRSGVKADKYQFAVGQEVWAGAPYEVVEQKARLDEDWIDDYRRIYVATPTYDVITPGKPEDVFKDNREDVFTVRKKT